MSYVINRNKTAKQLDAVTKKIAGAYNKLNDMLHVHLCECVAHIIQVGSDGKLVGDVGPLQRAVESLPTSARTATILEWIRTNTPVTKTKDVWHLKRGWTIAMFNLDKMEANPFWTLGAEKRPTPLSIAQFMGMLKGMSAKVERKAKITQDTGEVHFKGDASAAEQFFADLYSAAQTRANTLTPEQRGEEVKSNVIQLSDHTKSNLPVVLPEDIKQVEAA